MQLFTVAVRIGRTPQSANFRFAIVHRLLDDVRWLPPLLIYVGFDYLRRHSCRQPAVFAALE